MQSCIDRRAVATGRRAGEGASTTSSTTTAFRCSSLARRGAPRRTASITARASMTTTSTITRACSTSSSIRSRITCTRPLSAPLSLPRRTARRRQRALLHVAAVFTGIVQGKATVAAVESRPGFTHMTIRFPKGMADTARMGASVAINGTCLTVVEEAGDKTGGGAGADCLAFDLIAETLRATTLGDLKPGDEVNFERAARVGDEIGGHNVSGHVHTTAKVVRVEETPDNRRVVFQVERESSRWMRYILPKGFVAVDGCSLTVGEVEGDTFSVYLIPETLRVTVLGGRVPAGAGGGAGGSASAAGRCNIEVEAQTQAVVDTVERVLGGYVSRAVDGGEGPLAEAVRAVVGRR